MVSLSKIIKAPSNSLQAAINLSKAIPTAQQQSKAMVTVSNTQKMGVSLGSSSGTPSQTQSIGVSSSSSSSSISSSNPTASVSSAAVAKSGVASMGNVFDYGFFTLEGQKERLKNVADVIGISFFGQKGNVQANVSNKLLKTGLETVANHPYITAGVVAGAVTAAKYAVPAIAKALPTAKAAVTSAATSTAFKRALIIGATAYGTYEVSKAITRNYEKGGLPALITGTGTTENYVDRTVTTIPSPSGGEPLRVESYGGADTPSIQYQIDPITGREVPILVGGNSSYNPDTGVITPSEGGTAGIFEKAQPLLWAALIVGGIALIKRK